MKKLFEIHITFDRDKTNINDLNKFAKSHNIKILDLKLICKNN